MAKRKLPEFKKRFPFGGGTGRAKLEAVLVERKGKNDSPLLPSFFIGVNNKTAGFISRGHRQLFEYQGTGLFKKSLRQLEAFEASAFANRKFGQYVSEITAKLEREEVPKMFWEPLLKLKKPVHIDYTFRPASAAILMRNGYVMTAESVKALEQASLKTGLNAKAISRFLMQHKGEEVIRLLDNAPIMFVFTKPVAK